MSLDTHSHNPLGGHSRLRLWASFRGRPWMNFGSLGDGKNHGKKHEKRWTTMKNHETYHEKKHDNLWNTMRQPWKTVGKAMVWWNQEKHFLISCQVQHACLPQAMLGTDVLCQVRSQSVFSSMPWPWAFIIFICSHGAIIVVHGHSPQPASRAVETDDSDDSVRRNPAWARRRSLCWLAYRI